jgi:hypothetical protein
MGLFEIGVWQMLSMFSMYHTNEDLTLCNESTLPVASVTPSLLSQSSPRRPKRPKNAMYDNFQKVQNERGEQWE